MADRRPDFPIRHVGRFQLPGSRGRSKAEFIAKLGTVLEETDETLFWLELMVETEMVKASKLDSLMQENRELLAIFVANMNTAKGR